MKIAYLSTHYPSQSHTFIQGEIVALEGLGHDVIRMALNVPPPGALLSELDQRESDRTFYVKGLAAVQMLRIVLAAAIAHPAAVVRGLAVALRLGGADFGLAIKSCFQLVEGILVWDHCQRHGVTAVHAHFGQAPASVALLTCSFGNFVDADTWTWSMTIHGWHDFATEDTSRLRYKLVEADLVVCISDFTRAQLMRLSGPAEWHKINIVRCGIDLHRFAMREIGPPVGDQAVVVTTGRLAPEKGHTILLEALSLLRSRGVGVQAVFIGDGPGRADLQRAAEWHRVADIVEFAGAMQPSEVAGRLAEADVFCLPSFAEGLPVSIMEAMAVGIPVVTTFVAGTPELVVDGVTGWIVPAGNPQRLADALFDAITTDRRDAVVDAARRAVEQLHDGAVNIVALERLLRDCHERRTSSE